MGVLKCVRLINVQCWSREILANFQALCGLVRAFQGLTNQHLVLLHSGDNQLCPYSLVSTSRRLAYRFLAIAIFAIMLYLRVIFESQRFGSRSRPDKRCFSVKIFLMKEQRYFTFYTRSFFCGLNFRVAL